MENKMQTSEKMKMACAIMASGRGRRFGSNKLLADFHGEFLVMQILWATELEGVRRLVITRTPEVAQLADRLGIPAALHELSHKSDTIKIAVKAFSDCTHIMFCPADQPLLRKGSLETLLAFAEKHPGKIVRAGTAAKPGAPVVFPACYFGELLALSEEEGGKTVFEKHPEKVVFCPIPEEELRDADTPEELEVLKKLCL